MTQALHLLNTYGPLILELSGAVALTATALSKLTATAFPRVSAFLAALGHDLGAAKESLAKHE